MGLLDIEQMKGVTPMFEAKVALVTGAASGIGREVAQLYSANGARVVVSDISVEGGEETVSLIKESGGEAIFVKADVSKPSECEAMVEQALSHFGQLDIACNNAGITGEQNAVADYSLENWQQTIAINLSGVFYCMKYEIPAMLKAGGGSIVNVASILGLVAFAGAPAYVASKHGVIGLTASAAVEYGKQNIRVNAVSPGFIRTPMIADMESDQETHAHLVSLHPIGRLGEPEEVAELIIWLSSDKASFITGAAYPADGGYLAH
jgi:NAD(P)-dependent dehydrogenase (short-subunit alcohol dehydrogenase family)